MEIVNIYDAKTRLSQLVNQVENGEDVVVSRHGRPVARLTQLTPLRPGLKFGLLQGQVKFGDDFDDVLPAEVLAGFEGR